jgi:gas vesicle protein
MIDDIAGSNRGAFVLAALIVSDESGDVKKEVKGQKKEIQKRIKESKNASKPSAGYEALLKAIE